MDKAKGIRKEERQVYDIPAPQPVQVTSHWVETVTCPQCQRPTTREFPDGIEPGIQYGPELRSYAVSLYHYQMLSMERTIEALANLFQVQISEGTLTQWVQRGGQPSRPRGGADWGVGDHQPPDGRRRDRHLGGPTTRLVTRRRDPLPHPLGLACQTRNERDAGDWDLTEVSWASDARPLGQLRYL